jgi:hypothetical protein
LWLAFGLISISLGCGGAESVPAVPSLPSEPISLGESLISEIVPTSDGAAYVLTLDSGIWYVRGTEATRVDFEGMKKYPLDRASLEVIDLDVMPTSEGGAYAASMTGKGLWYLREARATRVTDSAQVAARVQASGNVANYFNLYVLEMKKRRALSEEEEHEEAPNEPDEPEY